MQQRLGYEPAFVRNMLQLNNGIRKNNNRDEPFYSEIGQLAGISETDWSWSVLMADFDNDGWKDIHITNGLAKDVTNNDYTAFKNATPKTHKAIILLAGLMLAMPWIKTPLKCFGKILMIMEASK